MREEQHRPMGMEPAVGAADTGPAVLALLRDYDRRARARVVGLPPIEDAGEVFHGIGFQMGDLTLVVSLEQVIEVMPHPRLTRVPRTRAWLKGIGNVRGRLISVVDLLGLLSGRPATLDARARVLALRSEDLMVGLLVEEVRGVRHFPVSARCDGADRPDWLAPVVDGCFRSGDTLWHALDAGRLLRSPAFQGAAA